MTSRRQFFGGMAGATAGALLAGQARGHDMPPIEPIGEGLSFAATQDALCALYDVDRTIVNFDAAYYGAMTRPVHAAYLDRLAWMNRHNSTFLRSAVAGAPREEMLDTSRQVMADMIGARLQEVALCAGGTEGLYALITNYALLQPGDAVLYCDVDYDEMQFAVEYLRQSRGAEVVRFSLPEPHTRANILEAYERALVQNPRAKLLLLTHVSNRNGLIPPVKEIVALAKARGVDVILDSAQAVGQMPFDVADIGADFVGFSLHKWVAAPLGTGGIYIRESRLGDIQPWLGNRIHAADDVRARVPTGTVDFAARLTIPTAVAVQDSIGIAQKFVHLKALRRHWVEQVREMPGVELMLPDEPDNHGAISAFRLPGTATPERARAAQALFADKYRLLVVAKAGLSSGAVLRVTPALFNTTQELDRLVAAIRQERATFT